MHDLIIALAYAGMVLAPAILAARIQDATDAENKPRNDPRTRRQQPRHTIPSPKRQPQRRE